MQRFSPGQTDSQVNTSFGLAFNLCFIWPLTCVNLHQLVMTCVDFGRAQIWTQVDASFFLPFGHPAQVNTSWLQVICYYKNALTNDMCEIYGFLWLANHLATLRESICKFQFCKLASTCEFVWPGLYAMTMIKLCTYCTYSTVSSAFNIIRQTYLYLNEKKSMWLTKTKTFEK